MGPKLLRSKLGLKARVFSLFLALQYDVHVPFCTVNTLIFVVLLAISYCRANATARGVPARLAARANRICPLVHRTPKRHNVTRTPEVTVRCSRRRWV